MTSGWSRSARGDCVPPTHHGAHDPHVALAVFRDEPVEYPKKERIVVHQQHGQRRQFGLHLGARHAPEQACSCTGVWTLRLVLPIRGFPEFRQSSREVDAGFAHNGGGSEGGTEVVFRGEQPAGGPVVTNIGGARARPRVRRTSVLQRQDPPAQGIPDQVGLALEAELPHQGSPGGSPPSGADAQAAAISDVLELSAAKWRTSARGW